MTFLTRFFAFVRANARLCFAVGAVLVLAGALAVLAARANVEANARKSPEQVAIEDQPDLWLAHPVSASTFRSALDADSVASVAIADASPGLVLYTLKN